MYKDDIGFFVLYDTGVIVGIARIWFEVLSVGAHCCTA